MQRVVVRAIGKLGAGWPREAAADFLERIRPFMTVEVVELPEGHDGSAKPDLVRTRQAEAQSLLKGIPDTACIIALDETGKVFSSTDFSDRLRTWGEGGRPIVFLIGGSWGLDQSVRERAEAILSFGKMTFPHALARVMLLEQLYRAAMIQSGKTYHK